MARKPNRFASEVVSLIGARAAQKLCERFGGQTLYIPRNVNPSVRNADRNQAIRRAKAQGASVSVLASDFALSNRQVKRILKKR